MSVFYTLEAEINRKQYFLGESSRLKWNLSRSDGGDVELPLTDNLVLSLNGEVLGGQYILYLDTSVPAPVIGIEIIFTFPSAGYYEFALEVTTSDDISVTNLQAITVLEANQLYPGGSILPIIEVPN